MSDTNENNEKLSGALGEILSNPQMLSAITSMAKNLKSAEETQSKKNEEIESKSENPEIQANSGLPEILNMLSSSGGASAKQNRRSELLCALKPYLSQERSDAIDKIIRFSELSSVFKELS